MRPNPAMSLEEALNAYSEHFGSNYPLCVTMMIDDENELIQKILGHIERNEPAPAPVYRAGCEY